MKLIRLVRRDSCIQYGNWQFRKVLLKHHPFSNQIFYAYSLGKYNNNFWDLRCTPSQWINKLKFVYWWAFDSWFATIIWPFIYSNKIEIINKFMVYLIIYGLPMGGPCSTIFADIVMDDLETELQLFLRIKLITC